MDIFFKTIAIIITAAGTAAAAVLFLLRFSGLYKPGAFTKRAWKVFVICSSLTVAASFISIDYWQNPPFKKIIKLPAKAEVLSCYKLAYDKREPFGNPWNKNQSVFGKDWFKRRGLGRILGQKIGTPIPELEAQVLLYDKFAAICIYMDSGISKAIIFERSFGGSSGCNFITIHKMEKNKDHWIETSRENHDRHSLSDFFSRFMMTSCFGLVFIIIFLIIFAVHGLSKSGNTGYIVPKRFAFSMIPSFILCVFGVVITFSAITPYIIECNDTPLPAKYIMFPAGCFLAAYGLYQIIYWREKNYFRIKTGGTI